MFYGRFKLRRVTPTVCGLTWMVAVTMACTAQVPPERTAAINTPAQKTTSPPPKVASNTSPPGMAGNATAVTGAAGLPKTTTPKAPPTTVVHNSPPRAKSGAVAGEGHMAVAPLPKTATLRESSTPAGRRDPFKAWAPPSSAGHSASELAPLQAGTRGLVISGLRLEGIVRQQTADGMIAVVTNYTKRAYFLRISDAVYNGVVSKITPEAIYFKENSLDSRGRVVSREVEVKMGSAPGEGR